MTTIDIRLIRPSPNPIRKSWDEDKMEELAASIKERGVIVPIKVRPAGDEFEVVYGHRRVEAVRRAGLPEVPAFVEGVEDVTSVLEQIIENEVREDVPAIERAKGYAHGAELLGSVAALSRATGIHVATIDFSLKVLGMPEDVQAMIEADPGRTPVENRNKPLTPRHVTEVSVIYDDHKRADVLRKAASEKLNTRDTRAVAEAYQAAATPELKDAVMQTSGKLGDRDRILEVARMKVGVNNMTERHEVERRQAYEEYDQAAKDFFDFTTHALRFAKSTQNTVRYGKFSPEAARFAIRRIDSLMEELTTLKEALEGVN